ncbi:hypothetical protein, partial [Yersinia pestis]
MKELAAHEMDIVGKSITQRAYTVCDIIRDINIKISKCTFNDTLTTCPVQTFKINLLNLSLTGQMSANQIRYRLPNPGEDDT